MLMQRVPALCVIFIGCTCQPHVSRARSMLCLNKMLFKIHTLKNVWPNRCELRCLEANGHTLRDEPKPQSSSLVGTVSSRVIAS